jgi:hypothetical protein
MSQLEWLTCPRLARDFHTTNPCPTTCSLLQKEGFFFTEVVQVLGFLLLKLYTPFPSSYRLPPGFQLGELHISHGRLLRSSPAGSLLPLHQRIRCHIHRPLRQRHGQAGSPARLRRDVPPHRVRRLPAAGDLHRRGRGLRAGPQDKGLVPVRRPGVRAPDHAVAWFQRRRRQLRGPSLPRHHLQDLPGLWHRLSPPPRRFGRQRRPQRVPKCSFCNACDSRGRSFH